MLRPQLLFVAAQPRFALVHSPPGLQDGSGSVRRRGAGPARRAERRSKGYTGEKQTTPLPASTRHHHQRPRHWSDASSLEARPTPACGRCTDNITKSPGATSNHGGGRRARTRCASSSIETNLESVRVSIKVPPFELQRPFQVATSAGNFRYRFAGVAC